MNGKTNQMIANLRRSGYKVDTWQDVKGAVRLIRTLRDGQKLPVVYVVDGSESNIFNGTTFLPRKAWAELEGSSHGR